MLSIKLHGVGPIDNRPSTTLSNFFFSIISFFYFFWYIKCFKKVFWHVTSDTWHYTKKNVIKMQKKNFKKWLKFTTTKNLIHFIRPSPPFLDYPLFLDKLHSHLGICFIHLWLTHVVFFMTYYLPWLRLIKVDFWNPFQGCRWEFPNKVIHHNLKISDNTP